MSNEQPGIADLRQGLDEVDSGIVRLIAQRRDLIAAIAKVKEHSEDGIQDPDREQRVLDGVVAVATDLGVSASLVRSIFRELISDSVAQQARHLNGDGGGRVRVAFQGTAHAYSDAAAQKYLAGRGLTATLPATARSARLPTRCWPATPISRCCRSRTPRPGASTRSTPLLRDTSCSSWARRPGRSTTAWPPPPRSRCPR